MTARCEISQLPLGECAGSCCRPDLRQFQPVPEVWMRVTEAAPARPVIPAADDIRRNNIHALFQAIGTRGFGGDGRLLKPNVSDMVRELCEPAQHREFYRPEAAGKKSIRKIRPRYHVTTSPPLLVQLYESVAASPSAEAGAARPASSRAAANVDAIDMAVRIDSEAGWWLEQLDADDPRKPISRVRRLGSLIPSLERCHRRNPLRDHGKVICCTAHEVEAQIARWWTWARVGTGWDLPAWEPDNTCPLCGVRGALRVRLVEKLATCINDACRETWDDSTIGLLADHIRAENHEDEEAS